MADKNFYVTTPIYYVNDKPHIGHAYTSLAADIIARFKKLDGFNTYFLTGTDEHGQKVEKSATDKGRDTKEFVDEVSQHFVEMGELLNLSNNAFIRTTDDYHKKAVQHLWQNLEEKGFIYKDVYKGWYAIKDEAFYFEDELTTLPNGIKVASSGAEVVWKEEESYFFKLSAFEEKLLNYYKNNPQAIAPKSRYNEVVSFIKSGLKDLSVSRSSFAWGIKVPSNNNHVVYVWLDALTNYISALGYATSNNNLYKQFWPADLHLVGKDIIRFHAVYWVAFLMAVDLPLPKKIFAHGWWLNEGQKISKSTGNVISATDLVNKYGLENIRYFLFKEVTFGNDGDFSHNSIVGRINNELANEFGNLLQRCLSLHAKNFNLTVTNVNFNAQQLDYLQEIENVIAKSRQLMDNQDFSGYIDNAWQLVRYGNAYINNNAPWALIKSGNLEQAELCLNFALHLTKVVAGLLLPFMPNNCLNILQQLSVDTANLNLSNLTSTFKAQHKFNAPSVVFSKLEV